MPDANKLTIELVDTGGESGRPPTSPGSSTDRAGEREPAVAPSSVVPKIDELVAATKELVSKIEPAADPQIQKIVSEGLKPEKEASAEFARKYLAQEARKSQSAAPSDDLPVIQPTAKEEPQRAASAGPTTYGKADVAVIEMNLLAADYAKRVAAKLLTYDEALGELSKAVKARGVGLTEALRGANTIGLDKTAVDHYRDTMRDGVRDAGLPVPANEPESRRPVAMPKPNRPVGRVVQTKEDREAEEKATEGRRSNLLLAGIGAQNALSGGGVGQKAAGAVQLAGAGLFGKAAAGAAGGPVGAAVQLAGVITDLVDGAVRSAGQTARAGIRTAGDVGTAVARNDGQAAFTKAVDGAADVLGKIPIAGTVAAEALKTFTAALTVGREVLGAFADRGRELRNYSGPIAAAAAQADVKKLLLDIGEANRFSAQYVRLIEAESKVNAAWRRASDPIRVRIMEFLANNVGPWLERVAGRVEKIVTIGENMMEMWTDPINRAMLFSGQGKELLEKVLKKQQEQLDLQKKNLNNDGPIQQVESWYTALDRLQLPVAMAAPGGDRQLKLPVLMNMGG